MKDMNQLLKEIKIIKSDLYASSDINCLGGKELFFQLLQMEYDILLSLNEFEVVEETVSKKTEVKKKEIRACSICRNIKETFMFKVSDFKFGFLCQDCFNLDPMEYDILLSLKEDDEDEKLEEIHDDMLKILDVITCFTCGKVFKRLSFNPKDAPKDKIKCIECNLKESEDRWRAK